MFQWWFISRRIYRLQLFTQSPLAQGRLRCGTRFDKVGQIGLKPALVNKNCWLAASIATYKLGLVVGLDFFQLRVQNVIAYLRSLPTDVSFENCTNLTT